LPRHKKTEKEVAFWALGYFTGHDRVYKAQMTKDYIRERFRGKKRFKNVYPSIYRMIQGLENTGLIKKEEKKEFWGRIPYRLTASGFIAALGALYLLDEAFPAITENIVQVVSSLFKTNSTYFPSIARKWDSLMSIDKQTPTHILLLMGLIYLLQIRQLGRTEVELYHMIDKESRTSNSILKNWWIPRKRIMTEEQFMSEVASCFFQGLDIITKHPILEPEEYDRWLEIQSRDKELIESLLERLEHEKLETLDYYDELRDRLKGKTGHWTKQNVSVTKSN